ncbi:MAG: hypothetical protein GF330_07830 [Candidatus Eisenbacteria bacterium]|nr:hypothetical protein [Candidatus Eisenbacteria bacterium]
MISRLGVGVAALVTTAILFLSAPMADEADLSGGVFVTHHPPSLQWTDPPPEEGWCQYYLDAFAVDCCEEQSASLTPDTLGAPAVWFILSAWDEPKRWCGVALGFDEYDPGIFAFVEWDHCCPVGECLELAMDGWPGPQQGVSFVTTGGDSWYGNFVPVYWFAGYAYGEGVIPIGPDPDFDYAAWGNCLTPPGIFEADCLGGMGIFTEGIECCPEGGPSGDASMTWGTVKQLYR